jgi:hypothetical protein
MKLNIFKKNKEMCSVMNKTEIQFKCVHVHFDDLESIGHYSLKVVMLTGISLEN